MEAQGVYRVSHLDVFIRVLLRVINIGLMTTQNQQEDVIGR